MWTAKWPSGFFKFIVPCVWHGVSVKISTKHKNIATGETSEAITFFTSFTILTSFNILTSITKKKYDFTTKFGCGVGVGGFFPLSGNGIPFTLFQLVSPDCGNWLTRWWNFHHMDIFVYGVIYRLHFHWLVKIFNNYTSISKNEYGGFFSQYSTPWASACLH